MGFGLRSSIEAIEKPTPREARSGMGEINGGILNFRG